MNVFNVNKATHDFRGAEVLCADLTVGPRAGVEQGRVDLTTSSAHLNIQLRSQLLPSQLLVANHLVYCLRRLQTCLAHGSVLPAGATEVGDGEGRPLSAAVELDQQV